MDDGIKTQLPFLNFFFFLSLMTEQNDILLAFSLSYFWCHGKCSLRIGGLGFGPWFCQFMVTLDKSFNQSASSSSFPQIPKNGEVSFQGGCED